MSDEARVYLCPNCGGPTSEAARRCEYCSAPVATNRCSHCFQMNVSGARHCSGCGRELGLSPEPEPSSALCPNCRGPLASLSERNGTLFDCEQCAGQFVENALLRDFLEQRATLASARLRRQRPLSPPAGKVVYRPCAICATLMNRRNFGGASGVIVDICTAHGVWFDAGELPRVLAFVENGGLDAARARALAAERQPPPGPSLTHMKIGNDDLTIGFSDFAAALGELLDFVRKLIKSHGPMR
ncbi:MAG TPA: zf-TFIIB domain-containing protein [Polyangiaceae bacterium]|nr:zf-TFIIB domain-containing protein [Polyangiaceae bacterium]